MSLNIYIRILHALVHVQSPYERFRLNFLLEIHTECIERIGKLIRLIKFDTILIIASALISELKISGTTLSLARRGLSND